MFKWLKKLESKFLLDGVPSSVVSNYVNSTMFIISCRESKKEQHKKDYKLKQSLIAEKLLWFQKHMDPNICPYTVDQTAVLVEK